MQETQTLTDWQILHRLYQLERETRTRSSWTMFHKRMASTFEKQEE